MFGTHDAIGATIGLSCDDRNLGHRRLGQSKEQFGAMPDNAAPLLSRPRQKARHILDNPQRDIEGVAEPNEPGTLD